MPFYLINPPGRRRMARKRRKGRKRRTAAQIRATKKMLAAARRARRAKSGTKRRKARRTTTRKRRFTVARRSSRRRVTRRRRRRGGTGTIKFRKVRGSIYRRNPPLVRRFMRGVQDGLMVNAGEAGVNIVAGFVPLPQDGIMGVAVKGALATGLGMVADRVLPGDSARMIVAGGFAAAMKPFLRQLPVIGPALGEDLPIGELPIGEYEDAMGSYPEGVGEYVFS